MAWLRAHKEQLIVLGTAMVTLVCLGLSLRGLSGNPSVEEFLSPAWSQFGPFESSNDRGRFALTYSLVEEGSPHFSWVVAKFASPDLAVTEAGQYVSLFPPGVSWIIIPGYIVGKLLGAAQVGAFATITLFACLNGALMVWIAKRLGAQTRPALLGALAFLFATPAFTYAVALSQHHVSVFLLLLSIALLLRFDTWWSLFIVWLLCSFSVVVDNPNFFLMLPVGLYALTRILALTRTEEGLHIKFAPWRVLTLIGLLPPLVAFGWFNLTAHGEPWQLAGTLERVLSVGHSGDGLLGEALSATIAEEREVREGHGDHEKTAVGFFETRNLLNGFDIHFTSPDRGTIWYAPLALLGIAGLVLLHSRHRTIAILLIATIGANIILYSLWGDPWGGWAFGSRYLIPTYALLSLALPIALTQWGRHWAFLTLFIVLFGYSVSVNTLGALGTSAIPPQIEVLGLEQVTGRVEKYDFERSRDYLKNIGSKSFAYDQLFKGQFSASRFSQAMSISLIALGTLLTLGVWLQARKKTTE